MDEALRKKILANPKYQRLISHRTGLARRLSAAMIVVYYGYILAVALLPQQMGAPVFEGGVTSLGFPAGVGVIVIAVLLTGVYVFQANRRFDPLIREIVEEAR
ncbi:DUF485 domain-containing protein [Azospirillum sp. TSO35-2]|uniref:DUF485 domain-containing protein n=1 Tax=Azospirillum sp. TSO35-2 TaxID=716796 RepID=UPI000D60635B|nr:DUF485 domain-containing protein [Azospirillum sp. TSO35-2]PWC37667.1 hypothetical protein TSO352_09090 [Azospirillum sp. TSO35-2]